MDVITKQSLANFAALTVARSIAAEQFDEIAVELSNTGNETCQSCDELKQFGPSVLAV